MSLNPFKTVESYPEMLNKIALFTFVVGVGMTWLLRSRLPGVERYLGVFDVKVNVEGNTIALGYILPAFLLALVFRVFKAHDRISDVLKIRERFDLTEILLPLAAGAGVLVDLAKRERLVAARDRLMYAVFYEYASGTKGKVTIDSHLVTLALDQWSWYWIVAEGVVVMSATALGLLLAGRPEAASWLLLVCFVLLWIELMTYGRRSRYAYAQVEAILSDPGRRTAIAAAFNAI